MFRVGPAVTRESGSDPEFLERAMGIEPTSEAWEASILPLYDARSLLIILFQPSLICTEV
jgi:hypothetical protein